MGCSWCQTPTGRGSFKDDKRILRHGNKSGRAESILQINWYIIIVFSLAPQPAAAMLRPPSHHKTPRLVESTSRPTTHVGSPFGFWASETLSRSALQLDFEPSTQEPQGSAGSSRATWGRKDPSASIRHPCYFLKHIATISCCKHSEIHGQIQEHIEAESTSRRQRESRVCDAAVDERCRIRVRGLDMRLAVGEGPVR